MAKQPTKLKKMNLNSVDFVRRGANPEAHIMLKKSYDDPEENKNVWQSLAESLKKAFGALNHTEQDEPELDIQKSADDMQYFTECLSKSYESIMADTTLSIDEKMEMLAKSTNEFTDTMEDYLSSVSGQVEKSTHGAIDYPSTTNNSKGGYDMGISLENVDKSLLTPEEVSQLDALIEKACKTEDVKASCGKPSCKKKTDGEMPTEGDDPEMKPDVQKSLEAELEAVKQLRKSMEMKEYTDVAKKYEIIGKKPEELAKTLSDMKAAGEEVYKSYIDALDEQVSLVEKSGMFAEIGKSGSNGASYVSVGKSEAEGKIEALAAEIRKSDSSISYHESIAKAWEQNPDLIAAYDEAYMN